VQQLLQVHPDLAGFAQGALPSIRLITIRDDDGIRTLVAHLRVGGVDAVADNFSQGGNAFPIDPRTGNLGLGTWSATADMPGSLQRCTIDDVDPRGIQVPHWPAVPEVARRVHEAFPEFSSLGHDITVTAQGPVVLECNTTWAARTTQKVHDQGFGATDLAPLLLAESDRLD